MRFLKSSPRQSLASSAQAKIVDRRPVRQRLVHGVGGSIGHFNIARLKMSSAHLFEALYERVAFSLWAAAFGLYLGMPSTVRSLGRITAHNRRICGMPCFCEGPNGPSFNFVDR